MTSQTKTEEGFISAVDVTFLRKRNYQHRRHREDSQGKIARNHSGSIIHTKSTLLFEIDRRQIEVQKYVY